MLTTPGVARNERGTNGKGEPLDLFGKKKKPEPFHAARIEDYAMIGDCETAALVSSDGSMDWLCWPSFSSPACLAGLLGTAENGYWRLHPEKPLLSKSRRYQQNTMVLETSFAVEGGEVCITDFMPPRGKNSDVVRLLRGVRGKVAMSMELVLRFDYGITIPWVSKVGGDWIAIAGPNMATLRVDCNKGGKAELRGEDMKTLSNFTIREGEEVCFALTHSSSNEQPPKAIDVATALAETQKYWVDWASRCTYKGPYTDVVMRSLLTLEALTYKPTGGVVAAATMGLPESIGGERNWDYRYCWLRDTSFTLLVLMTAGYTEEAIRWQRWLLRAVAGAPDQVQMLYGIDGSREMVEWNVQWLRGYEDSTPVRVGNAAAEQFQLDVFGEVASALYRIPEDDNPDLRVHGSALQAALTDHLCHVWDQPDEGIWEVRGGRKHFVHSKVSAWVGLDRAIKHYNQFGGKGDIKQWRKNRDMLHKQICDKGFNKKLNSFTQSYGSKALDASTLRLGLVGFLPMDDPRIVGTVDAIQQKLMSNGLVLRYETEKSGDGLSGGEGAFLACSFWLVSCLWLMGREAEAEAMFERLIALRNEVGLLSEEYDPVAKRMLGNFPQALSHIAMVHAAFVLSGQWKPQSSASAH